MIEGRRVDIVHIETRVDPCCPEKEYRSKMQEFQVSRLKKVARKSLSIVYTLKRSLLSFKGISAPREFVEES
jgi:hypothetical protein